MSSSEVDFNNLNQSSSKPVANATNKTLLFGLSVIVLLLLVYYTPGLFLGLMIVFGLYGTYNFISVILDMIV